MLKSLTVTNFALIENAQIEFSDGLTILTGETGAGKSILIDALSVALGARASVDFIRTGMDFFLVEAVFEDPGNGVEVLLAEQGLALEEDRSLMISRRLTRSGKNHILLNGRQTPLSVLRQIGDKLVDMHGQHENQALLRPETHLSLVDSAVDEIQPLLAEYRTVYARWRAVSEKLSVIDQQVREHAQRLDMLSWQIEEISGAALQPQEEEELEQEIQLLANAEKISNSVGRAYTILRQGTSGLAGVLDGLAESKRELETAVRYDERLQSQLAVITDALYQLEEAGSDLRHYAAAVEFSPARLSALQERMDLIYKLKRKYGATITDILTYYEQITVELEEITNFEQTTQALKQELEQQENALAALAKRLDVLRRQTAQNIAAQIKEHLGQLGMPQASFLIQVSATAEFTGNGKNEVNILFSANPGEEEKSLQKIASGGELSRIALAIKAVCAKREQVETMVFDEIDAGIGGQTALMVAERIAMVGAQKQVLCITHLPQIACMADLHLSIEKTVEQERTHTLVKALAEQDSLKELTRMISGNRLTKTALDNAAEMRKTAKINKEKWKNKA